jgi:predicted molibdopterin-dependent oxidoreductase YjgC
MSQHTAKTPKGQLVRLVELNRKSIQIFINGEATEALEGDTLLTAVLTHQKAIRHTEFSHSARAGFCLMGACQDCWVATEDGTRLRSCSTLVQANMRLVTPKAKP